MLYEVLLVQIENERTTVLQVTLTESHLSMERKTLLGILGYFKFCKQKINHGVVGNCGVLQGGILSLYMQMS